MEQEPGDDYIRHLAAFIRSNERGLAEAGLVRGRRPRRVRTETSAVSYLNPVGWFASDTNNNTSGPPPKPVVLTLDTHHLFYLLMRLEALGLDVGTLDVKVDNPSQPMSYINVFSDKSETLSLASFRSSFSAVSSLSLGMGLWGRPEPQSIDAELKYIYSSFTKVPALSLKPPGPKVIAELARDPPNENAHPLDAFKNLQSLTCSDIDPRTLLGWDKLSESLRSLTIKRSGLEDISDVFIGAVLDDQARREGTLGSSRQRTIHRRPRKQASFPSTRLPETVPEDGEATPTLESVPLPSPDPQLPSYKWAFLKHLSLSANNLTFLPSEPLPYLTSLTHLDLSSNLLVSVPHGLSGLYNLVYLNLSDNMIESVLGIYTRLGQILNLNLSRNRLESICGLERLMALERVDLRENRIEESAEIGRLATLPNIAEVYVEGNPLVDYEENYRIACFEHFWKERKNITLDGAPPGYYERSRMALPAAESVAYSRSAPAISSPPAVAVQSKSNPSPPPLTSVATPAPPHLSNSPQLSAPLSAPDSRGGSPMLTGAASKPKRRKTKRIVDLNGDDNHSDASASRERPRIRPSSDREEGRNPTQLDFIHTQSSVRSGSPQPDITSLSISTLEINASSAPAVVSRSRSRHRVDPTTSSSSADARSKPPRRRSALSPKGRRSPSVYEPSDAMIGLAEDRIKEADAYRARVEALRSDMGEGWLKVFNQSQMVPASVDSR